MKKNKTKTLRQIINEAFLKEEDPKALQAGIEKDLQDLSQRVKGLIQQQPNQQQPNQQQPNQQQPNQQQPNQQQPNQQVGASVKTKKKKIKKITDNEIEKE